MGKEQYFISTPPALRAGKVGGEAGRDAGRRGMGE